MKTPEDFRTLWTERFGRNDLNALYGTKRFENETERFGDGTKRFENETKRFGYGTKRFENGKLLRCSSALQGLYVSKLLFYYKILINIFKSFYFVFDAQALKYHVLFIFTQC